MELKFSKLTKSNDQGKILKMLSREEELSRSQGKWTRTTSIHKNKKKYDRKQNKKSLRNQLRDYFLGFLFKERPCCLFRR